MTKLLLASVTAAAALVVAGCGATGHEPINEAAAKSPASKKLFTDACGGCHILKDAGTKGVSGPNLDDAFACVQKQGFEKSTIRDVIRGQIDYAAPPMPRELLKGEEADDVSDYIATVAGQGVDCGGTGPKSGGA